MIRASEDFEKRWELERRRRAFFRWFVAVRFMLIVLIFGALCMALGWGWGYNIRLVEECAASGGQWQVDSQRCLGPDGFIAP